LSTLRKFVFALKICLKPNAVSGFLWAKVIKSTASDKELLETAEQIFAERKQLEASRGKASLKHSELITFARRVFNGIGRTKNKENGGSQRLVKSLIALRQIRNAFASAEIHFIHLPQKEEVEKKSYLVDIGERVKEMEIKYHPALMQCKWSTRMYFVHDAHPNNVGYDNIKNCVSRYLFKE
jgi:hypothetical protein